MAVEMINLLRMVVDRDASDLHLAVGNPPVGRVHGHLNYFDENPMSEADTERLMKSIASPDHQQELQEVGGADFGFAFEDVARFRVSCFKQKGRVGLVLRLIPNKILTFDELGLPQAVVARWLLDTGIQAYQDGERPEGGYSVKAREW